MRNWLNLKIIKNAMSEIQLSKKEIQYRLNNLKIKPQGLKPRKYGVSIKFFTDDLSIPEKRVDYIATAQLNFNNGIGELEISKKNIYFNQHEPDFINEIIANSISKSIYPLKVELNEKGLTPNEILNYNEVLERWKSEKKKISEKYQSDILHDFFIVVDSKFENKKQIERSLYNDWFWNLFYHKKFINYGDYRLTDVDLYLSVIPYQSPLRFSGTQKIEKIPTDYHSFIIEFQSIEQTAPSYFIPKNYQGDNSFFMQLKVVFDLDVYHHFPMHTRAYFEVYTKDHLRNKTMIRRIEFTQYQQNTEEFSTKKLSIDSPFITGGLVKLPPNKWGFDNFENLENNW